MAISTPTNKTTSFSDANATVYTVASQTYTAGRLYLLAVSGSRTSVTPDDPVLTGQGTWTQVAAISFGSSNTKRLTLYRYLAASTTTGTVTLTFANQLTAALWSLTEIDSGFDTTGTNGAGAITQALTQLSGTSSTSNTVALSAFGTGGLGFGVFSTDTSVDIVPANGYTELAQASSTAPVGTIQSQYRLTDADPGVTYTASRAGGIGIELKQGGATAYTMPADAGAFTLSGMAANPEYNRRFVAEAVTFALAGIAASLERGVRLTAATTSFAFSGQATSLEVGRKVAATSTAFALSGTAASLERGVKLAGVTGSFALVGTDATLVYTPLGGYTMTAEGATFAVMATVVSLRLGYRVAAASGSLALVGYDAAFVYVPIAVGYTLATDSGAFTLNGTDAAFAYARLMAALQAVYALDGTDTDLSWSGYVAPPTPIERIYFVAYQERVYGVHAEDRVFVVAPDDRIHVEPQRTHQYAVAADNRIYAVEGG